LALEHGDFIAELLDGFFESMDTLLEEVDNPQQSFDHRGPFGLRDRWQVEFHTVHDSEGSLVQLRLFPGIIELLRVLVTAQIGLV
jgi:hypothetical protein